MSPVTLPWKRWCVTVSEGGTRQARGCPERTGVREKAEQGKRSKSLDCVSVGRNGGSSSGLRCPGGSGLCLVAQRLPWCDQGGWTVGHPVRAPLGVAGSWRWGGWFASGRHAWAGCSLSLGRGRLRRAVPRAQQGPGCESIGMQSKVHFVMSFLLPLGVSVQTQLEAGPLGAVMAPCPAPGRR